MDDNYYDSSSSNSDGDDEQHIPRVERQFLQRINFRQITDPHEYMQKFRISAQSMQFLVERLGEWLQSPTSRNFALSPEQQLMSALHWLGNGSQYHVVADAHGLHKTTIMRAVHRVTRVIVDEVFAEEVRWPNPPSASIAVKFFRFANFPRVAGCIDGSLIPIDAPEENENAYVDRKGNHSINILVACGPSLEFYYASARWPGSVHDSRVLRNSSLFEQWENGFRPFPGAVLLGDSGYPLLPWLMTPVERPRVNAVGLQRYLRRHKQTRRLVECALGGLKEKFPCLARLRLKSPEASCKIILSCITLYNIQKRFNLINHEEGEAIVEGILKYTYISYTYIHCCSDNATNNSF